MTVSTSPAPEAMPSQRVLLVDVVRGFALMGIMLLHHIEHFNFFKRPDAVPDWLSFLSPYDSAVWDHLFLLFGGKAYALFSLLFGFSFWVMYSKRLEQGYDFSLRFMWRMLLLVGFGLIHSLFYAGDILVVYASVGGILVLTRKWRDWAVLSLAIFLILQPLDLFRLACAYLDPNYRLPATLSGQYFGQMNPAQAGDSFWTLVKLNSTAGQMANLLWTWEAGRVFQAPGLFLLGMSAARRRLFEKANSRFWVSLLAGSILLFIPLHYLKTHLSDFELGRVLTRASRAVITPYDSLAFAGILLGLIVVSWRSQLGQKVLGLLAPYGRMSLSNYLLQSISGGFLYYGYGLGLYHYCGSTVSLLIGITLLALQMAFSAWWLNHYKQGPLEALWAKATWYRFRPSSKV